MAEPQTGVWKSSLCACGDDCCTCCAAAFCQPIVTAQLAVRTRTVTGMRCKLLAGMLWLLMVVGLVVSNIGELIPMWRCPAGFEYIWSRGGYRPCRSYDYFGRSYF